MPMNVENKEGQFSFSFKGQSSRSDRDVSSTSPESSSCRTYSFSIDPRKLESDGKSTKKPTDELLFDLYKNEDNVVPVGKFIATDPRLHEFMKFLKDHHRKSGEETSSPEMMYLDEVTFKKAITPNVSLISKCLSEDFVIPDFKGFTKHIEEFYYLCDTNMSGKVADYIPQLARADPKYWGVSVCTVDGQRYSIGKTNIPFTIQSCSKPLTYAIALEELDQEEVHKYVGQEPSGRNFNELILDHNKKPHNPMINAGAIVVCSLLKTLVKPEMTPSEKFDFIMNYFKRLAGGEHVGFNNAVFLSEKVSADRNYALGFFMREHKCYPENTQMKEVLDFYFQCCSMETTCESFSVIAATLANGGICPITEEKVLRSESVGLPAKSGVSGSMLVVVPNTMGIALFSPPLDALGNSCRGVQFCEELVKTFNFHKFKFSGIDMTLSDYDGRTALHLAAAEGHEECVLFLLNHCGCDVTAKDRWGKTPLDEAKTFKRDRIIQILEGSLSSTSSAEDSEDESLQLPQITSKKT
ncbi:hypothetical protein M8J76_009580 [Diaphorina citri]|nr:hypothetical protein M8J76_009580 [Diaphorina citri]